MYHHILIRTFLMVALVAAISVSCGSRSAKNKNSTAVAVMSTEIVENLQRPVQYGYEIVATYPHDTDSYTQGLYWHDGFLWEGSGEYGNSKLRKVDLATGNVLREISLAPEYFGEGIALLNGKIYQLTWREGKAFMYDPDTFERLDAFIYGGEGWGITTDGEKLYMSDGSSTIKILHPGDFNVVSTFEVKDGRRSVSMLNELEWIEGKIWANVFMTDHIVIIDPQTGEVSATINLSGLLPRIEQTPRTDVLNGIAYDAEKRRIFVTGKRWPKVYEIKLIEKKR